MPKNYLAIDYGERRVGIAYASELVGIAFPRETIDLKEKNLWTELERLSKENKITDFILGMPIHPNNHPDSKQKTVEAFATELRQKFPKIELHIQDESYSTQEASAAVRATQRGCPKKTAGCPKTKIDKAAAAIILQRFLEGNF
ncbi:MAG: Holliday junction resolvase RuvX [Fibromonadaceae bacterium]|jgi:putative Holliday junction resolvase|nr:Holliday junction resolvase RuvX [Fibromonadaceae bacterium]